MSTLPPEHWEEVFKYGIYNDDGDLIGIRPDAPKEIKAEYEAMERQEKAAKEKGIML